tara:strand:+ start:616 stop:1332 length:717 start_codon:yes stop_codon:yes gene_type:complete
MIKKDLKIIAIIPARGGSKGIKEKNIKLLNGKPLIFYSINEALKLKKLFYKIIVSTDSRKIARISEKLGAEVPYLRPRKISKDSTPTFPVVKHCINFIEKKDKVNIDLVLILQPTSPLRSALDIKKTINIMKNNICDSVVSVKRVIKSNPLFLKILKNKYLKSYLPKNKFVRRQDVKSNIYKTNGAIYLSRRNIFFKNKNNLVYGNKTIPYIMSEHRSIDIDDEIDFKYCELIINEKK